MNLRFPTGQSGAVRVRFALAVSLVVGAVVAGPGAHYQQASAATAHAYATGSLKPDSHVDLGNTGVSTVAGPTGGVPSQVFNASGIGSGTVGGVTLDNNNNIMALDTTNDDVYNYAPNGTLRWHASSGGDTNGGADASCPPSVPVVSADGNVYYGSDIGNIYQVPLTSSGVVSTAPIFSTASGAPLVQTFKIGSTNDLFAGDEGGTYYRFSPTAGAATQVWSVNATGSTQASGPNKGTVSSSPFKFCGEAALDASDNSYVASSDTNPKTGTQSLGTLYKVNSGGAIQWAKPLLGAVTGAAVLDTQVITPEVIVADTFPELTAYDTNGNQLWSALPGDGSPFFASPALSPDGSTIYIPNSNTSMRAYNAVTGALQATYPITSGSKSSPSVDSTGNIYLEGNTGALYEFSASSTTPLFTIPAGTATGQSGSNSPQFMSPAIGPGNTIYVGGASKILRGFGPPIIANTPTNTPVPPTNTATNTPANTATNTNTPVPPTATNTNTPVPPTATNTNTATNTPTPALGSLKPDLRVNLGNTGVETVAGPTGGVPSQVFNASGIGSGTVGGVTLDNSNNILALDTTNDDVYNYAPNGTQRWHATTGGSDTNGAADAGCPPSVPVFDSADGNVYYGSDNGNIYQVPLTSSGLVPTSSIFSTASGKPLVQTFKIGSTNDLFAGDEGGAFYRFHPTAGAATQVWSVNATGSTQTYGLNSGVQSTSPFKFCGEAALDANDNSYVASTDTNPSAAQSLGTVYKINSAGAIQWARPILGGVTGSVVLDNQLATPEVIVADTFPEITAFDTNGNQLWSVQPGDGSPFFASPALSPDGSTIYIPNNNTSMRAYDAATGALKATYPIASGSKSSPIVDATGNIYLEGNTGTLYEFSPTSTSPLFAIPGGTGTGQSGSTSPQFMSPAIGPGNTIYVSGNAKILRGFGPPIIPNTPTNTPTLTNTVTNTPTNTATSTNTPVPPTSTSTNTPVPPTSTSTNTPVPPTSTSTNTPVPPTATKTNTPVNTATNTPVPPTATKTSTPVPPTATSTNTPVKTATNTPVPPTATPTSTPTNNCTLYSAPLYNSVSQTDVQAIGYYATKPNTTITATFSTGSPAYPSTAVLLVLQSNFSIKITNVTGTLVGGQYRYTFNDGAYGAAALGFYVPGNAHVGTSSETASCGGPNSMVSWQVTAGDPDSHHGSDSDADDAMPSQLTPNSANAHTHTWSFNLNGKTTTYTFKG